MDPFDLIDENPEPSKKQTRFGRLFGRKSQKPSTTSTVDALTSVYAPGATPAPIDTLTDDVTEPPPALQPATDLTAPQSSGLPTSFPAPENAPPALPIQENSEHPTAPTIDPAAASPVAPAIHSTAAQPVIVPSAQPIAQQPIAQQPATQPILPQADPQPITAQIAANPAKGKSVVSVRDITKIYTMGDMEVHALRGINLEIKQGEMVAVMGPSGSGKSTLMNIIGCLDVPTAGDYFLDDVDVSKLNDNALAEIRCHKIGFVFQSFNLLARTSAIANVELPLIYSGNGGRTRRERAAESLSLVGLGDRLDHKPNELSGGQQQRVAIARSLINQPTMILADEPTGNLDTATSVDIMQLFQKLNREQGITIVFVTHDPETADYCQRVIHFRDGIIERDERR